MSLALALALLLFCPNIQALGKYVENMVPLSPSLVIVVPLPPCYVVKETSFKENPHGWKSHLLISGDNRQLHPTVPGVFGEGAQKNQNLPQVLSKVWIC